jgi:GMP synthase-like glutamine amidotransferase
MKIGILKTDAVRPEWVPTFGEYPDMFVALLQAEDPTLEFVTFDVERGEFPAAVDAVDCFLVTGSKSSVYDDKDWIRRLEDFVRETHAARKKLVGICFGHQIVARALGGRAEKAPQGWGVGAHTARFSQQPDWHDGESEEFTVLVSHQDQVIEPAAGAETLAGSDFCPHAVCQLGEHILTFQGHPEFIKEYSRELLEFRRELIGEDNYAQGVASLGETLDRQRMARWILAFLRD